MSLDPRQVILAPVVSEKSYSLIEDNKYSFRVHPRSHKTQIRQAVEELFDVKVVSVNVIKVRPKPKRRGCATFGAAVPGRLRAGPWFGICERWIGAAASGAVRVAGGGV